MCVCVLMYSARSLWSGYSSCTARVTSSSAMLVGTWWVWLRPAHKALHPGTVLLPLQTGKQRPMRKPHRRPESGASLRCCFFQSHTCCISADRQVVTFGFRLLSYLWEQFHFNWTEENWVIIQAASAQWYSATSSKVKYKTLFIICPDFVIRNVFLFF